MKKILLSLAALICAAYTVVNAQQANVKRCSTDEYTDWLRTQDPGLDARMADVEVQMQKWMAEHVDANQRTSSSTIIIPVVVHVVYGNATQNISDDLIKSQIDVLNEDFGGYNSDAVKIPPFFRDRKAGDMGIRFQLAVRDPSGNVTNGIRRVSTTVGTFTLNNAVKYTAQGGDDAWPCGSYMNIWVCNLGSGVIGYGQFPGGSCATDGVVLLYSCFGRISSYPAYNYGRTTTHEINHCLNLRHIWGDDNGACTGSDLVADTPNAADANFGTFSCHLFTCSNQPTGDMYMNYMDYTDDKYLYMFTAGQATRIMSCINTYRASLLTSLGCTPVNPPAVDASISEIVSPGGVPCDNTDVSFIPEVTLTNFGSTPLTSVDINFKIDGVTGTPQAWTGTLAPGTSTNVQLPSQTSTAGDHLFYSWTSNPNGTTDGTPANDKTQRNFIGHAINAPYPISQGFETLPFPPANWKNYNFDCGTAWARTTTAFHSGIASAYFNNFAATATQNAVMDEIVTQPIDMTGAPSNPVMTFWKAYAQKSATGFDTLNILVSTDCGYNYTSIYKDWGTSLATAPNTTSAYTPSASEWVPVGVSLAPYVGQKNVIFAIRNINHGGNNLYIDDFNVTYTGINEVIAGVTLNVYPNPTEGMLNVSTIFENPENMQIIVTDALGQIVYQTTPKTTIGELTTIDLRSASKGIYFVELKTEKGSVVKKVSLSN